LKSVVVGATIAWATSTAQRMAADAAEVTLEAERRYESAVAMFEDVQREQSDFIIGQICDGMYDNAVLARVQDLGWRAPQDTGESFEDFSERVAADQGVTAEDVPPTVLKFND
jgi:hypothetical protein